MTSAARTTDRRGGFTLMEMVMVLAISGLVMAGAVAMMVYSSDKRRLQRASGEIEVFAKRARMISMLQQKPYALQFAPGKIRLMPLAEAVGAEALSSTPRSALKESATEEEAAAAAVVAPVHDEIALEEDFGLFVRRWGSDSWLPMDDRQPQVWRFDPGGLCEPVSVRLTLQESWIEQVYHPLTASVSDLSNEFR